ncbi:MAG: hypothetical protein Kow0069_10000 [Promethearchaeota archaeon]
MTIREKRSRSLLKGLSWRLLATIDTMIITWAVTGSPLLGFRVGFWEALLKFLVYMLHERAWAKSDFGRLRPEDLEYQI